MSTNKDLAGLLRALQLIVEAQLKLKADTLVSICRSSSFRPLLEDCLRSGTTVPNKINSQCLGDIANVVKDGTERINTVLQGLKVYADLTLGNAQLQSSKPDTFIAHRLIVKPQVSFVVSTAPQKETVPSLNFATVPLQSYTKQEPASTSHKISPVKYQIKLSQRDKDLLRKLDMEHKAKLVKKAEIEKQYKKGVKQSNKGENHREKTVGESINDSQAKIVAVPNPKAKLKLSENAKQRKVPSSRLGRMVSFGTLAAGLGVGTATEYLKQTLRIGDVSTDGTNVFLSKSNMERIVDTLCKVRGAALKLGQILSIQDESIISPELAKALERVRKSADFMPDWQVDQVMSSEFGANWENKFADFERKPFAAASIGQVHYGKLKDGREVAIKIQYPGVARGIESDIDNLGGIMKMWNVFPKGMFLDNLMVVAKRELAWEVDYLRESECTKKFKDILRNYNEFYVPYVVDEMTTKQVFTTELLDGVPVDQCFEMDDEHREFIGDKVMELCLLEILKFQYMQTDPNWANFLYNPTKRQLMLLDFGASREYSKEFMDGYVKILKAACDNDRSTVLNVSRELGFLTGYESKVMEDAHIDAVMILGEIFRADGKYDFANQDMTYRIQNLAQIMLVHRLCPPPEEVYSLHRKLSGVFLLLSKLKVKIECKNKFLSLYEDYIHLNP